MSIRRDALWTAFDTIISSGLAFLLRVIVARMLAPEDFGIAIIAVTIIGVLGVVNDFGLTSTLIQRDEDKVTDELIDTTFTVSVLITLILVASTMLLVAPLAAQIYGEPSLHALIVALGISLFPAPFVTVISALMFRKGMFRANAIIKVTSNLIGMAIAIGVLLLSPSPWVIVLQVLASSLSATIMLLIAHPYRYRLRIVRSQLGPIFGFSGFILLSGLLTNFQANAGAFVLGLVLSTSSVGYFAFAAYLTDTARKIVMSILNRVTFVHYSRNKRDLDFLREKFVATVRWNCRALFPLMTTMMLFGPIWAPQLMGPEWSELGGLIFWLSLMVIVGTAGGTTTTVFKSMGRPGMDLLISVCTTGGLLLPGLYLAALFYGLEAAAIATLIVKVIAVTVRLLVLHWLVPGAAVGALRASFLQAVLQMPLVLAWLAVFALEIETWYLQVPFIGLAFAIYAFYELPKAFPGIWQRAQRQMGATKFLGQ